MIDTQIECTLSSNSAGAFPVVVQLNNQGYSNNNKLFTYNLSLPSLSTNQGSVGGGLNLVLNGQGFSSNTKVTICGQSCTVSQSNLTSITCMVPKANNSLVDSVCDVIIIENSIKVQDTFTYLLSLSPALTSVSPLRGGTGGGSILTISGSNFP